MSLLVVEVLAVAGEVDEPSQYRFTQSMRGQKLNSH